tara:strand:+ start:95 stop:394 length:300 start_codon:yes stop_codon:yes gene_type:complete
MYAPKNNMNRNRSINRNNINLYNNNTNSDTICLEDNYTLLIYVLFVISFIFNLILISKNKKKFKIKNIKEQKNISIQTDPQIVSLLINPDNNVQIMNYE